MDDDAQLASYILEDHEMDEDEREGELVEAAGIVLGVTLVIADQRRQQRTRLSFSPPSPLTSSQIPTSTDKYLLRQSDCHQRSTL